MGAIFNNYLGRLINLVICGLCVFLLAACGGGGGSPGTIGNSGSTAGGGTSTSGGGTSTGGGTTTVGAPVAVNFASAVPNDKSIVIKGSGGNGRTEVAVLTFTVVDSANNGVPNVKVNFSTVSTNPVNLVSSSGVTDAKGNVSVALNSGTQPTTVRVVATVQGTSLSAMSDTVTVTTGQPTQTAFSLSVEKFYVEGWDVDNVTNKITALLADEFGGAVADGTQVVFTTVGGAVVGTGGARCLTVNGECNVTWRSQNPRTDSGVVTVTATATNSSGNLAASTKFYTSGSFGVVKVVSPVGTQSAPGGKITYDFGGTCTPASLTIELVDERNNPMPQGTTIAVANAIKGSATVSNSTVAYNGAAIVGGSGGTLHNFMVTPTGCTGVGTDPQQTGQLDISVKSPLGSALLLPMTFTFRAP
jgi:hypothetical protein